MRKGEVWQVSIPFTPGHVQAGDRPAVILTEDRRMRGRVFVKRDVSAAHGVPL